MVGNIDEARRPLPSALDDPNTIRVDIEECA
jgi:hypothetical protein